MTDDGGQRPRPPMDVYTAMLGLSFVWIAIGCVLLAVELFGRQLPLAPGP